MSQPKVLALPLDKLRLDGDTQPRVRLDREHAEELAELLKAGVELPRVVVFWDAGLACYWLASGFHRYHAHRLAGRPFIECEVRDGSLEDARLYASATNRTCLLKRTHEDKRRAAHLALTSPAAAGWTDERIAEHCLVPKALVAAVRATPWVAPKDLWGQDDPDAAPPATPASRLATGGTLRPEDKPRLTDADRELIKKQLVRSFEKVIRKAFLLDLDPVAYFAEYLRGKAAQPAEPQQQGGAP